MKYSPFLPLGFFINNLFDSAQNKVITVAREMLEKPIKLLWQAENKPVRELVINQKISSIALGLEVHINVGSLDRFSRFYLYH